MSEKIVYVYLPDGVADWELGFILPELHTGQWFKRGLPPYAIKTFAQTADPVLTMGGLRVVPDLVLDDVAVDGAAIVIFPGSYGWLKPGHERALGKAGDFLKQGVLVGAICGATIAFGRAGFLNDYEHTSNDLGFLKSVCPDYKGELRYRNEPVVTDRNLITAAGTAPLEFARNILEKLDVFSARSLEAWYKLYKTQDPRYYSRLMQSLPA